MPAGASFQDDRGYVVRVLMATACAVSKLVDRIKNLRWGVSLRVVMRLVIVGMTTRTVRFVGTSFPGDVLGIGDMTIPTLHLSRVFPWEERRAVAVLDGCPAGSGVTRATRA